MRILLLVILLLIPSCTTVTPVKVRDASVSYDGNERNGGLIEFTQSGAAVITPNAKNRYNALIRSFGRRFTPDLKQDYGVTAGPGTNFTMTAEALVKFGTMNRWRREALPR